MNVYLSINRKSPRWFSRRIARNQRALVGSPRLRGWHGRRANQMPRGAQIQDGGMALAVLAAFAAMFSRRRDPKGGDR